MKSISRFPISYELFVFAGSSRLFPEIMPVKRLIDEIPVSEQARIMGFFTTSRFADRSVKGDMVRFLLGKNRIPRKIICEALEAWAKRDDPQYVLCTCLLAFRPEFKFEYIAEIPESQRELIMKIIMGDLL